MKIKKNFYYFILSIFLFFAVGSYRVLLANNETQINDQIINDKNKLETIEYVKKFLKSNAHTIKCYKNLSGFIRMCIPPPENQKNICREIRLNYWLPEVPIDPESTHTHPQYFESMVIQGNYIDELFELSDSTNLKSTVYNRYRVYKENNVRIRWEALDRVHLEPLGSRVIKSGFILKFPTTLIHRILAAEPNTLTLNMVSRVDSSETHFDAFILENCKNINLKIEKDYLSPEESITKISEIINILEEYNFNQGLDR